MRGSIDALVRRLREEAVALLGVVDARIDGDSLEEAVLACCW
jgi:hypothetical protein